MNYLFRDGRAVDARGRIFFQGRAEAARLLVALIPEENAPDMPGRLKKQGGFSKKEIGKGVHLKEPERKVLSIGMKESTARVPSMGERKELNCSMKMRFWEDDSYMLCAVRGMLF